MAYTSLSALAAAMAPKVNGSSTMGVKKSTVCTRASSAVSLYTPASSAVSNPTSTFSSAQRGTLAKTLSNNFGLSLDAQPAAFTCAVSFRSWVCSGIDPYYNSGDATHVGFVGGTAAGIGREPPLARPANRPAPEEGLPAAGAERLDSGPPGRLAGRDRLSARVPAGPRDRRHAQGHRRRNVARRKAGLGVLPRHGAGGVLAAHRGGVPRRAGGHRGRPQGAQREAGHLGRGRAQRLARAAVLRQGAREGPRRRRRGGALQRLRGHRKLHQGRPRGDRPQQLDQLFLGRALEHHLRHRSAARATAS